MLGRAAAVVASGVLPRAWSRQFVAVAVASGVVSLSAGHFGGGGVQCARHRSAAAGQSEEVMPSRSAVTADGVYAFTATGIDGTEVPLSRFKGKVSIIVNVASF